MRSIHAISYSLDTAVMGGGKVDIIPSRCHFQVAVLVNNNIIFIATIWTVLEYLPIPQVRLQMNGSLYLG